MAAPEQKPVDNVPKKVIQTRTEFCQGNHDLHVIALCEDGSIWRKLLQYNLNYAASQWICINEAPDQTN